MIQSGSELRDLAGRVNDAPWAAIDTEADSLHSYPEKLCLLQIAIPGEVVLVDPLADIHLEPLWEAFDRHELILHAADYDLHLLFNCHHFKPASIFDTMWAARLLGESKFGLNDVLTEFLGITLEKGSQKADWGKRPLTPRMIEYALNDVRYLNELTAILRAKLSEMGRLEWHKQTCARLIEDCAVASVVDSNTVWRVKGHDRLDPVGLSVLREVWLWRERDALRTNRPPFFILKHESLSAIAAQASEGGIRAVKLPPYLTPRRRDGVLEAVRKGLDVPESERPTAIRVRTRRMTRRELDTADDLKLRRDAHAAHLNIDPTIIASRSTLFSLARQGSGEWDRLLPWQRTLLETEAPPLRPGAPARATREAVEPETDVDPLEGDHEG